MGSPVVWNYSRIVLVFHNDTAHNTILYPNMMIAVKYHSEVFHIDIGINASKMFVPILFNTPDYISFVVTMQRLNDFWICVVSLVGTAAESVLFPGATNCEFLHTHEFWYSPNGLNGCKSKTNSSFCSILYSFDRRI